MADGDSEVRTVARSPALAALTQAIWANCSIYLQSGAAAPGMADIEVTAVMASMLGEIMGNYDGDKLAILKVIVARNIEMGQTMVRAQVEKEKATAAGARMN